MGGRKATKTYCRLCAKLKPLKELTDLQADNQKYKQILTKLTRLHVTVDFNDNIWPKTICTNCTNTLNNAFDFTINVENAQKTLNYLILVHQVKEENSDSDYENIICEAPEVSNEVDIDDTDVTEYTAKTEKDNLKSESDLIEYTADTEKDNFKTESDVTKYTAETEKDNFKTELVVTEYTAEKEKDNYNSESENEELNAESTSRNKEGSDHDRKIPAKITLSWKQYKWMCMYCNKHFRNVDQLRVHIVHYHNTCNAYQCIDCKKIKYKLVKFLEHVRKHRHYLNFSCYKCFLKFSNVQDMENHEALHIDSDYVCFGCNTNFSNSEEVNKHVATFYKDQQARELPVQHNDSLTCTFCEKTLRSALCLEKHLYTHTDRKRDHICDVCGKGFFYKGLLILHMAIHSEKKPFQCEICKYSFKFIKDLRSHVTVHTGEKPHVCDECGRGFRVKKELIRHTQIHTDNFPYVCPHCDKRFRFSTVLARHLRVHTGVRPYSCEPCSRTFAHWGNYNKHMKAIHKTDTSKRQYKKAEQPDKEKMQEWLNKIMTPNNTRRRKNKTGNNFEENHEEMK